MIDALPGLAWTAFRAALGTTSGRAGATTQASARRRQLGRGGCARSTRRISRTCLRSGRPLSASGQLGEAEARLCAGSMACTACSCSAPARNSGRLRRGRPMVGDELRPRGDKAGRSKAMVHFDPWWNPAVEMQATDRAHRGFGRPGGEGRPTDRLGGWRKRSSGFRRPKGNFSRRSLRRATRLRPA